MSKYNMSLSEFILFISENYHADVYEEKVELHPFNNMQLSPIYNEKDL